MGQKETIYNFIKEKGRLTQGDISFYLYGDRKHLPNVYGALVALVKDGAISREGERPAYYSIKGNLVIKEYKKKNIKQKYNVLITGELIEKTHDAVLKTENYGKEDNLITDCFKRFPLNNDITIVAMKIGLIDITNSTHVSQHKSKISAVELAESIVNIKNIDMRIEAGDPEVVNEIAKSNGKINLFSFASKYCCYHNKNLYSKDDYSILDTVLKESLPLYFDDISQSQIQKWQDNFDYKSYNDYITRKLNELGIQIPFRKRKFDHFVWFNNR